MAIKLSQPVYEMVQTLLDVRNKLDDVLIDARHTTGIDAKYIEEGTVEAMDAIDKALDLIKYNE